MFFLIYGQLSSFNNEFLIFVSSEQEERPVQMISASVYYFLNFCQNIFLSLITCLNLLNDRMIGHLNHRNSFEFHLAFSMTFFISRDYNARTGEKTMKDFFGLCSLRKQFTKQLPLKLQKIESVPTNFISSKKSSIFITFTFYMINVLM